MLPSAVLGVSFAMALSVRLLAAGAPIYTAEVDGVIHPVTAEFMVDTIDRADAARAELVVFTLRTPGGLVDSTETINRRILGARTPVVVFVAPSGARAASAGFLITMAADVAAMAPGTRIGAAHPVSGGGQTMDETMAKKAAEDIAAAARTLAERRGRNVDLVAKAVTESRAFTEMEALNAKPPLIDLVASDLAELLRKLDGRSVKRFDGTTVTIRTAGRPTIAVEMSWRQRILSGVAHPQIAYLLFSLGVLGLTIELWNPGAVLPGVAGGVCLLLALFAFQILPVNYAGLLLIAFGILLLVLELKAPSFGLLGAGGILSMILGSVILMDSPLPELRVGLPVIVPSMLALGSIFFFLARLALTAQRRPSTTGLEGMLDETGPALTAVGPAQPGRVAVHGEIWNAESAEPIEAGEQVRVTGLKGLTLTVRPERPGPDEGRQS
jgi:membrane-bound serine protease (ClpP class)